MNSKSSDLLPEACRSLFLGDLSCFCQEIDIYRVFSQFGAIDEIRIKRNDEGNGLGYGFVTFLEMKSAEAALGADGLVILGRPVKISWANVRSAGNTKVSMNLFQVPKPKNKVITADSVETAQLHFSFISKHQVQLVTEDTVRRVFLNFGHVQDVTIKKTSTNPKTGEQTGYGFVHFPLTDAGIHSAICGAKVIRQVHISNVLYDCRLTWSLEEIIRRKQSSQYIHQSRMVNSANMFDESQMYRSEMRSVSSAPPSTPSVSPTSTFPCFQHETTSSCPPVYANHLRQIKPRRNDFATDASLASLSTSSLSSQMSGLMTDSASHVTLPQSMGQKAFSQSFSFDEQQEDPYVPVSLASMSFSSASQGRIPSASRYLPSHPNSPFQLF